MKIDHYSIALRVLSRREAMKRVKADLWSRGVRLSYVPMRELHSQTDAYFDEHAIELLALAARIIETEPRFAWAKLKQYARNKPAPRPARS